MEDILEACQSLGRHVAGRLDELGDDEVLRLAAERLIEIIGEAAAHVSDELRTAHPEVDWRGPPGVRTILAHRYFGIDVDVIRVLIERDIPRLERQVRAVLGELRE